MNLQHGSFLFVLSVILPAGLGPEELLNRDDRLYIGGFIIATGHRSPPRCYRRHRPRPCGEQRCDQGVQAACIIRPESESSETVEVHGKAAKTATRAQHLQVNHRQFVLSRKNSQGYY